MDLIHKKLLLKIIISPQRHENNACILSSEIQTCSWAGFSTCSQDGDTVNVCICMNLRFVCLFGIWQQLYSISLRHLFVVGELRTSETRIAMLAAVYTPVRASPARQVEG